MANESVMAGPVYPAATVPVMEKSPAPIMTPTPSATRLQGLIPVLMIYFLFDWLRPAGPQRLLMNNPIVYLCIVINLGTKVGIARMIYKC